MRAALMGILYGVMSIQVLVFGIAVKLHVGIASMIGSAVILVVAVFAVRAVSTSGADA